MEQDTTTNPQGAYGAKYATLSPTQKAVFDLLMGSPDGLCRLDFAAQDFWEVSNRIAEVEARMGVVVERAKCDRHNHRHPVVLYSL